MLILSFPHLYTGFSTYIQIDCLLTTFILLLFIAIDLAYEIRYPQSTRYVDKLSSFAHFFNCYFSKKETDFILINSYFFQKMAL